MSDARRVPGNAGARPGRVLFLCTGNYYRSRFAEEVFNHLCEQKGLPWRADSRGLDPDVDAIGNTGNLSPLAIERLLSRGYVARGNRPPMSAVPADLDVADLIVALDRDEHQPLVMSGFPAHASRITYWDIKDILFEIPSSALDKLEARVIALIDELEARGRKEFGAGTF